MNSRPLKLLFLLLAIPEIYLTVLFVRATGTQLQVEPAVQIIGKQTTIQVKVTNPHGTRSLRAFLVQGGQSFAMHEESSPDRRWSVRNPNLPPRTVPMTVGADKAKSIRDGKAQLVVESVSNDLRGRTDRIALDVTIITQPPAVSADDIQRYFTLGGSGLVVFTAGGYWTEAGVRVGAATFPSYPVPGANSPNRRLALFALPYDMGDRDEPVVFARNPAGNEATARIRHEMKRKKFRHREIAVTDGFLDKIFGELDPAGAAVPRVERFKRINAGMRAANAATLRELAGKSAEKRLWNGAFQQLPGSAVEAQFCDYRSYKYQGEKIDEQVHLGFDLATTAHAPVVASNDGLVLFAAPLGIYGNAVVIDHGQGLQSLYAHMSELAVKPNDIVRKGQGIGKTGATGLAGGDHLHFTILIGGVPVNPVEWWDAHWIQDRIDAQLAAK